MKPTSPPFPSFLYQLVSPRRYKQYSQEIVQPAKRLGAVQWVLSRALCRFFRIDLRTIPRAQRDGALKIQLQRLAPHAETASYVVLRDGEAMVWLWDAARIDAAIQACGLDARRVTVIPETLLYPVQENGLRLLQGMEGFEAQFWSSNCLVASQWWPRAPDGETWLNFQRDASLPPARQAARVPIALGGIFAARPWARALSLRGSGAIIRPVEGACVGLLVLALWGLTLWYGMQWWNTQAGLDRLTILLQKEEARALPMQEARISALSALERVEALSNLESNPSPLALMAKVAEKIPGGAYLKEWEFNAGRLSFLLASPVALESGSVIKALQQELAFQSIEATAGAEPSTLKVSLMLATFPALEFAARDESSNPVVLQHVTTVPPASVPPLTPVAPKPTGSNADPSAQPMPAEKSRKG